MQSGSKISDYLAVPFTWIGKASASLFNVTISKLVNVEVGKDKKEETNLGIGITTV